MASLTIMKWQRSFAKRYAAVRRAFGLRPVNAALEHEHTVARWHADGGEHRLRYDYDVRAEDVVFDLGGYEGAWSAEIFARYRPRVYIFEPAPAYADQISQRFAGNDRIRVVDAGLAGETKLLWMGIRDDATGAWTESGDVVEARLVQAAEFLETNRLGEIALCKINIEGGEYELLEHLLDANKIGQFRNLQIQFHSFVPDAEQRMAAIQRRLQRTHQLTYQYPFVWENWRRRDAAA